METDRRPAAPDVTAPDSSRTRLRLALDAGALGTWHWDAATGETTWDDRMRAIFGVGDDWDGTLEDWVEHVHPEDRAAVLERVHAAVHGDGGGRYAVDHRIVRPDGAMRWIEGLGQVLRAPDGGLLGSVGSVRDITGRVGAVERASQLQQVTSDLAAAMTVEDLTRLVGRHMQATVGATSGGVALRTPDGRHVQLRAWFGYDPEMIKDFLLLPIAGSTPLADAVRTGEPQYWQAPEVREHYPAIAEVNRTIGSRSLVALPLVSDGEVLGGLVFGFVQPQPLDDDQRTFFAALAGQVALAVSRSVLFEQLREVTRELQAGLAPGDLPEVPGLELAAVYRPGGEAVEEIGGDWFDVVRLPDGTVAVVVGDVMGRGVRASTTMTRLRSAVRALLTVDPGPEAVVTHLDAVVARERVEDFVTLLYGVLDVRTGALHLVDAGHLPPLLVPREGPPRLLTPLGAGPPVGLAQEPRTAASATLAEGDVLLLFTDGLVERRGSDLDEGFAALAEQAAVEQPSLQALVQHVTRTLAPSGSDDVTVLALRRRGQPPGSG